MDVRTEDVQWTPREEIFRDLETRLMHAGVPLSDVRATLPLTWCQWLLRTDRNVSQIWAAPGTARGLASGVVVRMATGDLIVDVDTNPTDEYSALIMEVFIRDELAERLIWRSAAPRPKEKT